jgi:hypothetical protein
LEPADSVRVPIDEDFDWETVHHLIPVGESNSWELLARSRHFLYTLGPDGVLAKRPLQETGPQGVGPMWEQDGYLLLGDSALLYVSHREGRILSVGETKAEERYQLGARGDFSRFSLSTYTPVVENEEWILIPQFGNRRFSLTESGSVTALNKKNWTARDVFAFPVRYDQALWGDNPYLYLPAVQYTSKLGQYFVSFPIENELYVYDSAFHLDTTVFAGSAYFASVRPYDDRDDGKDVEIPWEQDRAFFSQASFFSGLWLDEDTQTLLRIVRRAVTNELNEPGVVLSIIFFKAGVDETKYLGEWVVPGTYQMRVSFVHGGNLYLFNEERLYAHGQEDALYYDVFPLAQITDSGPL